MKVTVEIDLKWYEFDQNNSGGYFREDENQAPLVLIQAQSTEEAWARAEDMFDFGYCECCGERWSYPEEGTDTEEPSRWEWIDGKKVVVLAKDSKKSWYREYAIAHYYDGRKERINFQ